MSIDLWTKMALTVIAFSLAVIAWKLPFTNAVQAQQGTCGLSGEAPCYVASGFEQGLRIQVTNPQDFH
jgi:hypothetical protein